MNIRHLYLNYIVLILMIIKSSICINAERSQSAWRLHLPDPITSFGACKEGGYIYVYGGHVGDAHVYSKETHSKSFVRLNLKSKKKNWEKLPFNDSLQGFGMAAYKGRVFISGGSQATNEDGEESNLSSLNKVSVFDIRKKRWSDLPPLPEPRSSHEMIAHDGKLFIVGGWHMADGKGVEWHNHGLVADLSDDPITWEKLPETDWVVRANSAAIVNDNLYVIGGLNDEGTTNAVRKLNLDSNQWSEISDFPSTNRIKAFGSASCELGGKLLVSPFSYQPRFYNESNSSWQATHSKVKEKRFFHRLVPLNKTKVLFVGGASWDGHLDSMEILDFSPELNIQESPSKKRKKNPKSSNWGGFRGAGNSVTFAHTLPLTWSDKQNISWRKSLEGYGQSTPVLWGNNIFCTSTKGDLSEISIIHCYDLKDGSLKWQKEVSSPVKIKRSQYVSQAAPSPVVDAYGVYVFFENGLFIAFTHEGQELWRRSLTEEFGPMKGNHGVGSSLCQLGESLGLLIDHAGPSYLLKVKKETGETEWRFDRPERVSWSSPTLVKQDEQEILFISSNGVVECFNFKNGLKIWSKDGIEGNTVASPTYDSNLLVIGSSKPDHTRAFKCKNFNFEELELVWIADDATSSFGSPLIADDFLYLVNRAGVATCHDLANGKKRWDLRLPGSCWASPLHAPDRIYFFTKEGETIVLKDDGSKEILAQNKLSIEGRVYGYAVADSKFVLRTGSELICLGGLN